MISTPSSPDELRGILAHLRTGSDELARISRSDLLEPLGRLSACWQPGSPWYERAGSMLEGVFGRQAVERALQGLALALNPQLIEAELNRELGRADLLDNWQADELNVGLVKGYPLGVVAHVLAGNVFLGGVIALAQSLLTRNAVLLKLSREDSGFTALLVEALAQVDERGIVKKCLALAIWDSARDEFNEVLRQEADAVVVWGGAAAIAAYPQARCRGRVIHYGPRLGIGIVLHGVELRAALRSLAWDVALWEQRACSSPRVLFVEDRDGMPARVAGGLSSALSEVCSPIPAKPLSLDEKAEVVGIRELAWWQQRAEIHAAANSMDHSVLLVKEVPADIPLGYRTVLIVPVRAIDDLSGTLAPYRDYLQTAVLAAPAERWLNAVDVLASAGITQVAAAGAAAARFLGLPHEGEYALRRLVRLVGIDMGAGPLVEPRREPIHLPEVRFGKGN